MSPLVLYSEKPKIIINSPTNTVTETVFSAPTQSTHVNLNQLMPSILTPLTETMQQMVLAKQAVYSTCQGVLAL